MRVHTRRAPGRNDDPVLEQHGARKAPARTHRIDGEGHGWAGCPRAERAT
jgi:hypothetical protein